MFKLILHHTYKMYGEAVDISRNENHGFRTAVSYTADGTGANTGVLNFDQPQSRIRVTSKPVWMHPRALKIEMWVYLTALGQRRNLVEGELSFAFFIHPDGVLWGTFLGPETPGGAPTWHGANSDVPYSPDGVQHTVPLNTWTKVTYLHDGISSLRLYIDDQLVGANYNLIAAVPSVNTSGVHIGHWPGDDRYTFSGRIDEIKIWKYDPEVPYKQFFCRPETRRCWKPIFDSMGEALGDKERQRAVIGLMLCINDAQQDLLRQLRRQGEPAMQAIDKLSERYRELWCSGNISGDDMKELLSAWLRLFEDLLGPDYMNQLRQRMLNCWQEFEGETLFKFREELLECDPDFVAYINLFTELVEGGPEQPEHPNEPEEPEPPDEEPTQPDRPNRPDTPKGQDSPFVTILKVILELIRRLFSRKS
ncbi:MAG: LamG domain-containing protein [Anaerolineae bacterium]|nr:LamG domain-containing protein [Anaerolineae bacterium]